MFLVLLCQCEHDFRARLLHSLHLFCLDLSLLMLENGLLADVIDFTIDFSHECDWDVWHEIENVDGRPCASAIEVSRIR
jgi:hypothetical protein